jgi:GNAT superfamily N-acetyltransferase
MGGTAELIADGGAAAAGDELFRSAEFHRAEGITHTLRVTSPGRVASLAVKVEPVPGGGERVDAVSAYGYPGAAVEGDGEAPAAAEIDWRPAGLVSVFGRERLAGQAFLAGARKRGRLFVHDPSRPRGIRRRLVEQVRQLRRRGYAVETVQGGVAGEAERAAFHAAYTETMRGVGAADRYFFDRRYLDAVLDFARSWLLLARSPAGAIVAGAIAGVSDRHLHYFLGGTADAARADSPFKLVATAMLDLADELGRPLNLGAGYRPGDGLERFKRGFANAEATFRTHEVVCDPTSYAELTGGRSASGFFPAYRAPVG